MTVDLAPYAAAVLIVLGTAWTAAAGLGALQLRLERRRQR